jgi:hypothetical protein
MPDPGTALQTADLTAAGPHRSVGVRTHLHGRSEVARDDCVSRPWVIELVQRYLAEGEAGLQPRSRRPRPGPRRTTQRLEARWAVGVGGSSDASGGTVAVSGGAGAVAPG